MNKRNLLSLGVASLILFSGILVSSSGQESPPVVLITLESVRAGNIPCYGYERNTAPNTCELAEDGVLFRNGYSNGPHTLPSLSALHTSRYPNELGAQPGNTLPDNTTTLADLMNREGYDTYGITNTWINTEKVGLDKGFDYYIEKNSFDSVDVADKSRKKVNTSEKFFLWAHLVDPHQGYSAPENFSGMYADQDVNISAAQTGKQYAQMNLTEKEIEYIEARYDEEIRYSDYALGKIIDWLKEENRYEESLIIVVGDHGEDFMEHGHIGHGQSLREVYTHVPFIVKFPGNRFRGREVTEVVSPLDFIPTIEQSLATDFNYSYRGKKLQKIVTGEVERVGVISQMMGKEAITTPNWKFIEQEFDIDIDSQGRFQKIETEKKKLFNLSEDIEDRENVIKKHPRRADYLEKMMYRKINSGQDEDINRLDPYLR